MNEKPNRDSKNFIYKSEGYQLLIRPRTEKGLKARVGFIRAAAEVFASKGFNQSSVESICEKANAPVGCFYRYFRDKEDLLSGVIADFERNLLKELQDGRSRAETGNSPSEALFAETFRLLFDFIEDHYAFFQAFREAEFVQEKLARSFYETVTATLMDRLGLRQLQPQRARMFAYFLLGTQSFFTMKYQIWERSRIPDQTVSELARLLFNGIARKRDIEVSEVIADALALEKSLRRAYQDDPRSRLLSACEEIFGRTSFKKAAVSEICRKAGVSVGSFYDYFDSKRQAFQETTIALRHELVHYARHFSKDSKNRLTVETRAFVAFFVFIGQHPYGYKLLREAEFVDFDMAADYYLTLYEDYVNRIREGAQSGEFNTTDYETLALILMGVGHIAGLRFAVWEKARPSTTLLETAINCLFYGAVR